MSVKLAEHLRFVERTEPTEDNSTGRVIKKLQAKEWCYDAQDYIWKDVPYVKPEDEDL